MEIKTQDIINFIKLLDNYKYFESFVMVDMKLL